MVSLKYDRIIWLGREVGDHDNQRIPCGVCLHLSCWTKQLHQEHRAIDFKSLFSGNLHRHFFALLIPLAVRFAQLRLVLLRNDAAELNSSSS